MFDQSQAAKRTLESKPGGSNPEPPEKKQTPNVDMEGAPGWVRQLMKKMDNVEAKVDGVESKVDGMSAKVDNAVQAATKASEDVKDIEMKVGGLQTKMNAMEAWRSDIEEKVAAAEFKDPLQDVSETEAKMNKKLKDIEADIAKMKGPMANNFSDQKDNDGMARTAVFGGFGGDGGGQREIDWLTTKLKEMNMDPAETPYFKGDTFKGLLFAKFRDAEMATKAIDMINKNKLKHGENDIRCKPDAPVEVRAIRSLLLGLRWQLNEWGSISKKSIRVDVPNGTMTVGGAPVMAVCIVENKLKVTWIDSAWEVWTELHQSTEMSEMIESGNKKLEQSALQKSAEWGKGKGKGKSM